MFAATKLGKVCQVICRAGVCFGLINAVIGASFLFLYVFYSPKDPLDDKLSKFFGTLAGVFLSMSDGPAYVVNVARVLWFVVLLSVLVSIDLLRITWLCFFPGCAWYYTSNPGVGLVIFFAVLCVAMLALSIWFMQLEISLWGWRPISHLLWKVFSQQYGSAA
jgi:hypothetical protein